MNPVTFTSTWPALIRPAMIRPAMTWHAIAPALGNHLWQSTLFALAAALLTLILRKNQARARYWLWLAASMKFLIPFSWLVAVGSNLSWRHTPAPANNNLYYTIEEIGQPFTQPANSAISSITPTPASLLALTHFLP